MSEAQSDLRDALPVGTVVGEYELEALLGHGGYSVVYRARHVELGQAVALKEYLPADLSVREGETVFPRSTECAPHYEDGKRRFLEEAKRIVEFKDDPGVVACLGFFRANGTAYLVLEHVDGMSLAELLRQREAAGRPLDESELRSLVLPLLETLSRLHDADVLHRDIKPSNILVRRLDGSPVLIDFGAAKQHAALHSKSVAPFTEGYAALEQVGEGELGPWTDVYAIGAVMWRIVAGGKPPWEPPNPKKVELRASAVLMGKKDPLPSAVELGRGRFSPDVLLAVDKCLEVRVDERIRSCTEIQQVIEEIDSPIEHSATGNSKSKSKLGSLNSHSKPTTHTLKSANRNRRIPFSVSGSQVQPIARYCARMIDTVCVVLLLGCVLGILEYSNMGHLTTFIVGQLNTLFHAEGYVSHSVLAILISVVEVIIESWLIAGLGVTPGKFICGIRLCSTEGSTLPYHLALNRSITVYILGLGFGIPGLSFITAAVSYFRLRRIGSISWDRTAECKVLHKELGEFKLYLRIFFLITTGFLFMWFLFDGYEIDRTALEALVMGPTMLLFSAFILSIFEAD